MDQLATWRSQLFTAINSLITEGVTAPPERFAPLALKLFAFQYQANPPYREFCAARGITPERIADWSEIPAFPTAAFKEEIITSFPREQAVMAQLTSGTTANRRGEIYRDQSGRELVLAANRTMSAAWLFPDLELTAARRCRIMILAPSPALAPSMGMAIGMEETRRTFGDAASRFYVGRGGVQVGKLVRGLERAATEGVPVALIGATGAFVYFLQAARRAGWRFPLAEGSRLADGGGYRGRFGPMERAEFHQLAQEVLNLRPSHCVNVLGMAESATNYFESSLRGAWLGDDPTPGRMLPPPWCRVQAVDLTTLAPLPPGEVGLLRHYDLANLPTVLAVQSDNLGVCDAAGGFRIVGRARVVAGKVLPVAAERSVGPLGDNRVFRMLEQYVNFSLRFKMGWLTRTHTPSCPCGAAVEQLVAEGGDPPDGPDKR